MGVIYKGLIFDGVSSLDYGIYITGEDVYNAPTRDVEAVEVPGRNGELILDKGRFSNISVTYKAGTFAQSQEEFAEKLSEFRNAILSRVGYKRLEDDYHPDEFRMAIYTNGLEVGPVHYSEAGEFELTFNCKPQRFLKSGEEPQTIGEWGETETVSGSIATFEAESNTGIKSLVVDIEPNQSGTGDPSPTNVRPISGWSGAEVNRTGKNLCNLVYGNKVPSASTGQMVSANGWSTDFIKVDTSKNYVLSLVDNISRYVFFYDKNQGFISVLPDFTNGYRLNNYSSWANVGYVKLRTDEVASASPQIQLELGTTATAYEPYQGSSYSIPFKDSEDNPITVYGGEIDVVSGEGKSTMAIIDMGDVTWVSGYGGFYVNMWGVSVNPKIHFTGICSCYKYGGAYNVCQNNQFGYIFNSVPFVKDSRFTDTNEFKTAMSGQTMVVEVETPTPIYCEPTEINTIDGVNNIWADSGEVSVEIGDDPNILVNPTPFSAQPLVEAEGHGIISIDGQNINILPAKPLGNIVLWKGTQPPDDFSVKIPLDVSKFNTGDKFYLSVIYSFEYYGGDYLSITQGTGTSSNADFIVNNATISFDNSILRFDALAPDDIEFTIGTAKTVTTTFTITTTNPSSTVTLPLVITYDPTTSKIEIGVNDEDEETTTGADGSAEGFSSVVIENTTYIDCEIGEAYYLENGEVISANNSVSLPASLPELKAGNNPITHDDTITDLKITPRWWKI